MPEPDVYIRGATAKTVDNSRVWSVVAVVCTIALAVLIVVTMVDALRENSRASRLRDRGVPVTVTIVGCVALASGTGITASGYRCTGEFVLDGRSRSEVVNGSAALLPSGSAVRCVVVPGDPTTLTLASAVHSTSESWNRYVTPAVLTVLLVAGLAGWRYLLRRRGAATDASASASS